MNTVRLEELLDRLAAPGRPGDALTASEFAEVVDDTRELIKENNKLRRELKKKEK